MGDRANYVVIENGKPELWYSRWGALRILEDLAWSPEAAVAFIRGQAQCDWEKDWLNETWFEGGALVDLDQRRFAWCGVACIDGDPAARELFQGWMHRAWPGWGTEYLHGGIVQLAQRCGLDDAQILARRLIDDHKQEPPSLREAHPDTGNPDGWITVQRDGGVELYGVDGDPSAYGEGAPALLRALKVMSPCTQYWTTWGGLWAVHLDPHAQRMDVCVYGHRPCLVELAEFSSPGWEVIHHHDDFAAVAQLGGGAVRWPRPMRPPDVVVARALERCVPSAEALAHRLARHPIRPN